MLLIVFPLISLIISAAPEKIKGLLRAKCRHGVLFCGLLRREPASNQCQDYTEHYEDTCPGDGKDGIYGIQAGETMDHSIYRNDQKLRDTDSHSAGTKTDDKGLRIKYLGDIPL